MPDNGARRLRRFNVAWKIRTKTVQSQWSFVIRHSLVIMVWSFVISTMTESTHGIILRTRPLTDTSLIVHWLTPDFGRIATVAKGARRPRSPFAGKLDLFYAADFSFSRSRRSDLHILREASLRETHGAIREDVLRLQQAGYAAGFVEQATEMETPLPEIFELTLGFVKNLCRQPPQPQNIFALELKLLRELGLGPDFEEARLTPGAKKIVQALLEGDWPSGTRLKLSSTQAGELRQFLHGFLIFHLGRLPHGRAAALAGLA
jgi:DNA repair protein RecO (recombination protein O)